MSINFIPLGNAIDLVTSAVTDSITGNVITDAVLTAVLKTEGGTTLATSSALTHEGGGIYSGTFDISAVSLTLNTHYYLALAASNYAVQWKHLYRAEDRPFTVSSSTSASIADDTVPGSISIQKTNGKFTNYSSLAAAKSDAVSGETIFVGPGTYTVTASIAKNGVNWHFSKAKVQRIDTASGFIFDDSSGAMTYTVAGTGEFVRDFSLLSAPSDSDSGVIKVSNASSDVTFMARRINGNLSAPLTVSTAEHAILHSGGKLTLDAQLVDLTFASGAEADGFCYAIKYTNGEFNGRINRLETNYDQALADAHPIYVGVTASPTGVFRLLANKIYNANYLAAATEKAIDFNSSQATASAKIIANTIAGSIANHGGIGFVQSAEFLGAFLQDGVTGTSETHLSFDKVGFALASTATAQMACSAGTVFANVRQFAPSGSLITEIVNVSGGTFWLDAMSIAAASSQDALTVSAGTLNVISGIVTNGGGGKADLKRTGGTLNFTANVTGSAGTLVGSGSVTKLTAFGGL